MKFCKDCKHYLRVSAEGETEVKKVCGNMEINANNAVYLQEGKLTDLYPAVGVRASVLCTPEGKMWQSHMDDSPSVKPQLETSTNVVSLTPRNLQ